MKDTSLLILSLLFAFNRFCNAAEPIEGYFEKTIYTNCWPSYDNYTPKGCRDKDGISIQKRNKSTYYVWLHTSADFGHFCSYRGLAHWENEKLVSVDDDCKVFVELADGRVNVNSKGEDCSSFCGARGHLWATGLMRKTRLAARFTGPAAKKRGQADEFKR